MSPGLTARVVPDLTGLDKSFDYLVPDELRESVVVGSIVRVPLGPRRVRAWVVALGEPADVAELKPLAKVSGLGPDAGLVSLASWAARRWAGRRRPFLVAASPPTVVKQPARTPARTWSPPEGLPELPPDGGVVRVPPCADVLITVKAAAARGPLIVCVPAVDQARLLAARLKGAGLRVAVEPRDAAKEWALATGGVDVVIGARTVVWAPCAGLAGIMVLDEHDEALQDERTPTWHARDVAVERARRAGVPCWLVSPSPTLEALAWAGPRLGRPSRNDERAGWPILEVVDRTREDPPLSSLVTRAVFDAARDRTQRLVCVLNTKGRARRLVCKACRAKVLCAECGAAMSQDGTGRLVCMRCDSSRPAVCQECGSTRLVGLGIGISRLRDELEQALRRPVIEVSADTDLDVGALPVDAVFIGTEAVLHRVHDADVVVFLDIDDELLAPRFRAGEETMALLIRAARMVGGRAGGGRLVVQTEQPRHDVLQAVLHADPGRLVDQEWARRSLLALPPVTSLAAVSGTGAATWLSGAPASLTVSGPADGRFLVRSGTWDALADGLGALGPKPRDVRVEVDPHRV